MEFQFHHVIPHEITVRTYRHIAADLNGIVGLELGWHVVLFGGLLNPAVRCIVCCAIANAYLGQLSHRQAHMLPEKRDPIVNVFQRLGLMLEPDTHRRHHKTYDQGFPILVGWCDALVTFLFQKVVGPQWIWLALFLAMTFGGIVVVAALYLPLFATVWEGKPWAFSFAALFAV